eukprot:15147904-Ditylum_brightwellii.AAC.1
MTDMTFKKNKADPCLYFNWIGGFLILWMSWVDDCLVAGPGELVKGAKKEMISRFECNEIGKMDEYVGCKVERDLEARTIRLTQPVLLQSYTNEFQLDEHSLTPSTPAELGSVLSKGEGTMLGKVEHKRCRTGVGKL